MGRSAAERGQADASRVSSQRREIMSGARRCRTPAPGHAVHAAGARRAGRRSMSIACAAVQRSRPGTRGRAGLQGRSFKAQRWKERPKRSIPLAWSGSHLCDGSSPSAAGVRMARPSVSRTARFCQSSAGLVASDRALATATLCIVPCAQVGRVGVGPARNASACSRGDTLMYLAQQWTGRSDERWAGAGPAGARGLRKGSLLPGRSRKLKAGAGEQPVRPRWSE